MILLLQKGIIFPSHQYCLKTKRWHLASLFCYCACLENRPSNLKIHQHHRVRAHGCRQTHLSCHNVKAHFRGTVNTTIKRAIYPYVLFLFNVCILRYYLSKPLTSLSCSLNTVFPGLKMWDTFACATAIFLAHFIISIAVLENVPPDAGLQKRATFSTLTVGLPGPGIEPGPPACQAAALTAQPFTTPFHGRKRRAWDTLSVTRSTVNVL
jgi:hypothetical protein